MKPAGITAAKMEKPPMPVIAADRKKSAAKGEIEKAASAKRPSFMKAQHEKPAMKYDANVIVTALCKPWELGGHPHDFLVSHRSARTTDAYQHYETDKYMLKLHEKMVAEKEEWNRHRKLREDMLNLLTRLHSIEKQRRQFIEKRKMNHPEGFEQVPDDYKEENANIKLGAINLANTFFEKRPSQLALMQPYTPSTALPSPPKSPPISPPKPGPWDEYIMKPPSPRTAALRQQVQDLDIFEEKLHTLVQPAAGSAVSFPKRKKK